MIALALLLLGELTGAAIPQQTLTDREAAVLEDSAIRYKYSSHWGTEWEPTKDYLTWFEYSAVCRNGQVEIVAKGKLWNASGPGLIKELSRRIAETSDYLKLWGALENLGIMNLETKDYDKVDELIKKGLNEEAGTFLDETWAVLRLDQDYVHFLVRIKERTHEFQAYDVPGLRDQTYLSILKEMVHFFGYAPPPQPLAEIKIIRER